MAVPLCSRRKWFWVSVIVLCVLITRLPTGSMSQLVVSRSGQVSAFAGEPGTVCWLRPSQSAKPALLALWCGQVGLLTALV
jgi:hypothetical protein